MCVCEPVRFGVMQFLLVLEVAPGSSCRLKHAHGLMGASKLALNGVLVVFGCWVFSHTNCVFTCDHSSRLLSALPVCLLVFFFAVLHETLSLCFSLCPVYILFQCSVFHSSNFMLSRFPLFHTSLFVLVVTGPSLPGGDCCSHNHSDVSQSLSQR